MHRSFCMSYIIFENYFVLDLVSNFFLICKSLKNHLKYATVHTSFYSRCSVVDSCLHVKNKTSQLNFYA